MPSICGPPPVNDDRVQPDVMEEDDVADEAIFQLLVLHGVASVLDDHDLIGEPLDVGKRFQQDVRLFNVFFHL